MAYNNNTMHNSSHGIIVVCHNLLSCGIYATLVSLILDTAISTSFSILIKCFILVSLVFHCITKCNLGMLQPHPFSAALTVFI